MITSNPGSTDEPARILIVDDEPYILKIISFKLRREGFVALEAQDPESAWRLAIGDRPDLVLLDVCMPGFDGYAVGGLAVGEGQEAMFGVLDYAPGMLPQDKPRYLMGVGKPDDIVGAVKRGIDMMDCVLPSRSGRTGQAFTRRGVVNIKNARHADDPRPLDEACGCPACPPARPWPTSTSPSSPRSSARASKHSPPASGSGKIAPC